MASTGAIRCGGLTATEKSELWDRWKRGESLSDIGRAMGRYPTDVFKQLSPSGGIRPRSRCRSERALTLAEREEISRGIAAGHSMRSIASSLSRSPSTISREITRNGGIQCYRANTAEKRAWGKALRPKPCKLVRHRRLRQTVRESSV